MDNIQKFQDLLEDLFQFDAADLDFGIYRIMNYKRGVIERFIREDLPKSISEELAQGALAGQTQAAQELEAAKKKVLAISDDALDAAGNLIKYHDTKPGKEYLVALEKAKSAKGYEALEAAIYNHLYAFFSRYWQDGDFISKRRYSKRERYAIPYNGEEVTLYWANHDQYYIKTGEYFTDYTWKATNGVTVHFKLIAADIEQNNVKGDKRFFLPQPDEIVWDESARNLTIPFEFRPLNGQEAITYGGKNQQEAIIAKAVENIPKQRIVKTAPLALAALEAEKRRTGDGESVTHLEHHLRQYTRRNTSDFFIHKDLKGFLSRELDFYLKNEVVNLEEMEAAGERLSEGWFQMVRLIKKVGCHIIEFLAQIEEFQKMLWEKRKFITEASYCISLGNIGDRFYPVIAACNNQWAEWKELLHIDEQQPDVFSNSKGTNDRRIAFLKAQPTLMIDTKHFTADFVDLLLSSFVDIERQTDGLLIHSENFHGLRLLAETYREQVSCAYIDPPYNTDASPILYKNGYKSSSWASLIENRLHEALPLLSSDGVLVAAIDDEQQRELSFIMSSVFHDRLLGTVCVRANPSGRPTQTGYSVSHEYLIFAGKGPRSYIRRLPPTREQMARFSEQDEQGQFEWRNLRREGSNSDRDARRALYYPIYIKGTSIHVPKMEWDDNREEWRVLEKPKSKEQIVWPDNEDGVQKTWRWEWSTVVASMDSLSVRPDRSGRPYIYYKRRPHEEGVVSVSCWFDAKYSATEHGTAVIKALFGSSIFPYPKSIHAVVDSIYVGGASKGDAIVLDYFAGSGTSMHATINLNRLDGGHRKCIVIEVEKYFDTILLPRIKKVTFTPEWKDGKPLRMATADEAKRSPRIVKVIRLESYEDTLNNIAFDEPSGQQAMQFEDYRLQYMLQWETRKSETLLNVEKLVKPFSYKLHIHHDGAMRAQAVDLPETFAYLLGLYVQKRQALNDNDRRYLVYRGATRAGRKVAVIWRETEGWKEQDYKRDKEFVAAQKLTEGMDEVYVNGDSYIPGARALEPLFKARMFAEVEA